MIFEAFGAIHVACVITTCQYTDSNEFMARVGIPQGTHTGSLTPDRHILHCTSMGIMSSKKIHKEDKSRRREYKFKFSSVRQWPQGDSARASVTSHDVILVWLSMATASAFHTLMHFAAFGPWLAPPSCLPTCPSRSMSHLPSTKLCMHW